MMNRRLFWAIGIGWPSVFITAALYYACAITTNIIVYWLIIILTSFWTLVIITRMFRWNGSKWRRIHYRAMLVYSGTSGYEAGRSVSEKREFDMVTACKDMAYRMIDPNQLDVVDHIMQVTTEDQGFYYYELLDSNIRKLYPKVTEENVQIILNHATSLEFSPQMVISALVLNKYGDEEATKYIMACMKGYAS